MTYKAPRRFASTRPHLEMMMADDPAAAMSEALVAAGTDPRGRSLGERIMADALKRRGIGNQQYVAMKGVEGIAWEIAATETLQAFALGDARYLVVSGRPSMEDLPGDALSALVGAVHVELADLDAVLPGGKALHGVSFVRTPKALAVTNPELPDVQIALWPRVGDGDWAADRSIGHLLSLREGEGTLLESVARGVQTARRKLDEQNFAHMLRSNATTTWNRDLSAIVAVHANALAAALADWPAETTWQRGIPPYLLKKLEGPKGAAAEAALLRRGFVREARLSIT